MSLLVRGILAASLAMWTLQAGFADDKDNSKASGSSRASAEGTSVDSMLVTCLIKENENEVAIARYAQKQAKHKDVQDFAEQMVKDHTAFIKKLEKFDHNRTGTKDRDSERTGAKADRDTDKTAAKNRDNDRDTTRDKTTAEGDRGAHGNTLSTMMQIGDEVAKKCLATQLRELGQKEGNEFDKCYIGSQIHAHLKMTDMLDVYKKHVSSELREVLSDGEDTAKEHLSHAKRIMKELESSSSNKTTSNK